MNTLTFRPRAEALEDRATPVSPADLAAAVANAHTNAELLEFYRGNPDTFTVATNAPSTRVTAQAIIDQSQKAIADIDVFIGDLVAQAAANPSASATLKTALDQVIRTRLRTLDNLGTAQQVVMFIDVTNQINSAGQRALATALLNNVIDTNGTTLTQFQQQQAAARGGTTIPGLTNTNGASGT
jgi:hypothetical protein